VSDRLLTANDLAEWLSVPVSWVRESTRSGAMPHTELGRYKRYREADIARWLEECSRAGREVALRTRSEAARVERALEHFIVEADASEPRGRDGRARTRRGRVGWLDARCKPSRLSRRGGSLRREESSQPGAMDITCNPLLTAQRVE